MKWFTVVSIVSLAALSTLSMPNPAHAQWVKKRVRIDNSSIISVDQNSLDVKGDSHYTPGSDAGDALSLSASSQRGDNEDSAYVKNFRYTAVQEFEWSFAMQGPPTYGFSTDVGSSIGGSAGPPQASVPANAPSEQQIGLAGCFVGVGNVRGSINNHRSEGTIPAFHSDVPNGPTSRTTQVRVNHQTEPTVDIYYAELGISMVAGAHVDFVIATDDVEPIGGGGGVAFLPSFLGKYGFFCPSSSQMTFYGKGCHAECHGTLSFSNPYATP